MTLNILSHVVLISSAVKAAKWGHTYGPMNKTVERIAYALGVLAVFVAGQFLTQGIKSFQDMLRQQSQAKWEAKIEARRAAGELINERELLKAVEAGRVSQVTITDRGLGYVTTDGVEGFVIYWDDKDKLKKLVKSDVELVVEDFENGEHIKIRKFIEESRGIR